MTLRIYCQFCSSEVRGDTNVCPTCGLPLDDIATRRLEYDRSLGSSLTKTPSFDSSDNAPVIPGDADGASKLANDPGQRTRRPRRA